MNEFEFKKTGKAGFSKIHHSRFAIPLSDFLKKAKIYFRSGIKQKIHSSVEQRKMFWTIEVVLSGEIATILTNVDSYAKIGLLLMGFILFFVFIENIRTTNRTLISLFKKMEGLTK